MVRKTQRRSNKAKRTKTYKKQSGGDAVSEFFTGIVPKRYSVSPPPVPPRSHYSNELSPNNVEMNYSDDPNQYNQLQNTNTGNINTGNINTGNINTGNSTPDNNSWKSSTIFSKSSKNTLSNLPGKGVDIITSTMNKSVNLTGKGARVTGTLADKTLNVTGNVGVNALTATGRVGKSGLSVLGNTSEQTAASAQHGLRAIGSATSASSNMIGTTARTTANVTKSLGNLSSNSTRKLVNTSKSALTSASSSTKEAFKTTDQAIRSGAVVTKEALQKSSEVAAASIGFAGSAVKGTFGVLKLGLDKLKTSVEKSKQIIDARQKVQASKDIALFASELGKSLKNELIDLKKKFIILYNDRNRQLQYQKSLYKKTHCTLFSCEKIKDELKRFDNEFISLKFVYSDKLGKIDGLINRIEADLMRLSRSTNIMDESSKIITDYTTQIGAFYTELNAEFDKMAAIFIKIGETIPVETPSVETPSVETPSVETPSVNIQPNTVKTPTVGGYKRKYRKHRKTHTRKHRTRR